MVQYKQWDFLVSGVRWIRADLFFNFRSVLFDSPKPIAMTDLTTCAEDFLHYLDGLWKGLGVRWSEENNVFIYVLIDS